MVIVKILGGLGNQMFQYALGVSISLSGKNVKYDLSEMDEYKTHSYQIENFKVNIVRADKNEISTLKNSIINRFFRKLNIGIMVKSTHIYENVGMYNSEILKMENAYLDGYWQSEKYFVKYREHILNDFTIKTILNSRTVSIGNEIDFNNSVSLHIRRGDYVTNETTNKIHGVCSLDYYQSAVSIINQKLSSPVFYIFSDDIDWARENLKIKNKTVFVSHNDIDHGYEDMYLMSKCKHNIIANSSFSWWAAWLNQNPGKIVINPSKWFVSGQYNNKDLIPAGWISL